MPMCKNHDISPNGEETSKSDVKCTDTLRMKPNNAIYMKSDNRLLFFIISLTDNYYYTAKMQYIEIIVSKYCNIRKPLYTKDPDKLITSFLQRRKGVYLKL